MTKTKFKTAKALFENNLKSKGGHYPIGANMHWHGGMHFTGLDGHEVRAISDGEIVAFRIEKEYRCRAARSQLRH